MRSQPVDRKSVESGPTIINEKANRIMQSDNPEVAVRAIYFVNVDGLDQAQLHSLYHQLNEQYKQARGGVHYVIPIRDGKLTGDILFEKEILEVVNKLCEVKDGSIQMRDGYKEVVVLREIV